MAGPGSLTLTIRRLAPPKVHPAGWNGSELRTLWQSVRAKEQVSAYGSA
jgi:hypothetical protein